MFDAIVQVCHLNPKIDGSYIGRTKQALLKMGKTPEDVKAFGGWWYANDWRGKQGQAPTPNLLVLEIEKPKISRPNTNRDKGPEEDPELAAALHTYFEEKRKGKKDHAPGE
jgi:hypothetical protein